MSGRAQEIRTQMLRLLRQLPVQIHNNGQTLLCCKILTNVTIRQQSLEQSRSHHAHCLKMQTNLGLTVTIPTITLGYSAFLIPCRKRSHQQSQRASLCTPKFMPIIKCALYHYTELACAFTCHINRCNRAMPRYSARD
jgi:hypothetical protein